LRGLNALNAECRLLSADFHPRRILFNPVESQSVALPFCDFYLSLVFGPLKSAFISANLWQKRVFLCASLRPLWFRFWFSLRTTEFWLPLHPRRILFNPVEF
jgi:hypothetical protein